MQAYAWIKLRKVYAGKPWLDSELVSIEMPSGSDVASKHLEIDGWSINVPADISFNQKEEGTVSLQGNERSISWNEQNTDQIRYLPLFTDAQLRAIFVEPIPANEFEIISRVLGATSHKMSPFDSAGMITNAAMMLTLKLWIIFPCGRDGIYRFSAAEIKGFQFGKTQGAQKCIVLTSFRGNQRQPDLMLWDTGAQQKFTQEEIGLIVQSFKKISPN